METENNAGYRWTGHPLVDMGIATIMAFSDVEEPEQLNKAHLEAFSNYAEEAYFSPYLSGYLSVLFTANFLNPSWKPEQKKRHVHNLLKSFQLESDKSLPICTFCGRESIRLPYLNETRGFLAYRDLVPMISGEAIINFFPDGKCGLPLCGLCTLAIQALTIGSPSCEGNALIVSSDNPKLTLDIVKNWVPEQRARIQLSFATGEKTKWSHPLTRLMDAMAKLENIDFSEGGRITLYVISNSGQGPSVEIFELPAVITFFFMKASQSRYRETWHSIVNDAWEKLSKNQELEQTKPKLRNYLYEDLFKLPGESQRFIKRYLLPKSQDITAETDQKNQEAKYRRWNLTELFLKEVVAMNKERIEAIRNLADQIADEIAASNDRDLWWKAYTAQSFQSVRNLLISQSRKLLQNGKKPLITLDHFLNIFEEGEELARTDWRLAWDLVMIRLIEQLYQQHWFEKNKEALIIEEK